MIKRVVKMMDNQEKKRTALKIRIGRLAIDPVFCDILVFCRFRIVNAGIYFIIRQMKKENSKIPCFRQNPLL